MSNALANLKGLEKLLADGYSLSEVSGHLVINDVWYVTAAGEQAKGRLALPLTKIDPFTVGSPVTHQILWNGSPPCFGDRSQIPLAPQSVNLSLGGTTYISNFSNKPLEGFSNYTDLVTHYVSLISGPAEQLFGVSPRTGAQYDVPEDTSPFKVSDSFSARAQITDLQQVFANERIAIIGLGGTGGFVLDSMVKTPVYSIDAYDFDVFQVHNGFRSPGEVPFEFFGQPKTKLYEHKYASFRHRLQFHQRRIGANDGALFANVTFAFVCVDDGEARNEICTMLMSHKVPFIDVGMGVEKENERLDGLLRTTLVAGETSERAKAELPFDKREDAGAYRVFVQIAELNALNAAIAVIRYKQFRRFYADDAEFYTSLLSIGSSNWVGAA